MSETEAEAVHIGRVADRTGLSHRTIRHYEESDLVVPTGNAEPSDASARTALNALVEDTTERRAELVRQLDMADEFIGSLSAI